MRSIYNLAFSILFLLSLAACKDNEAENSVDITDTAALRPAVAVPTFNADTAYQYVAAQVAFGPRVPGTPAQKACADWMEARLRSFCDTVYRQTATVAAGDKKPLPCINLIGSINPGARRRVLLLAHWDTRPWADQDTKDKDKPILGADDAGSGVAVLLELARVLKGAPLPGNMGIDILFTDVEDYGRDIWGEDSYCLGTQYWARNLHVLGYRADYGILLDMVGARGARFPMEGSSAMYAPDVQQRVWQAAVTAGYSSFFPATRGGYGITDDHVYVNKLARIPTIDIIHLTGPEGRFPSHWHTHRDNMEVIDKSTLQAVGQTLLQALFEAAASVAG